MKILYGVASGLVLSAFLAFSSADAAGVAKPLNTSRTSVAATSTVVNGGNGYKCQNGNNHRVPEPSTLILLGAGIAGLVVKKVKKS